MGALPLVSFVLSPDDASRPHVPELAGLLAWQCHALDLPAELVVVEPEDVPSAGCGGAGAGAFAVRGLRVRLPPALRDEPSAAAGRRLRQNAGIRVAAGRLIAALDADRLPSAQLLRWIGHGGPKPGGIYWTNSWFCDASRSTGGLPPRERLAALVGGLHHVQTPFGTHPVRINPGAPPHQLMWELVGWTRRLIDQRITWRRAQGDVLPVLPCDSFLLMDREDWWRLRGFPEWPLLQGNFGTILAVLALAVGLELRFAGAEHPVLALTAGPHVPMPDIGLAIGEEQDEGERLLTVRLSARTHLTDDHAYTLASRLLDPGALRWMDGVATIANPAPVAVVTNGPDWGTAAEIVGDLS